MKRKKLTYFLCLEPTRPERVGPPKKETNYDDDQHKFDEDGPPQAEAAYRSSSPPIPALKNKDKKQKAAAKNVRRQPSSDDMNQQQPNGRSIQREPSSEEMNQQQPPPPPKNVRRQPSFDDASQLQSPPPPLPPLNTNDDYPQTPNGDDRDDQGRHTYRKPPAHRPPGLLNNLKNLILILSFSLCWCRSFIRPQKATT